MACEFSMFFYFHFWSSANSIVYFYGSFCEIRPAETKKNLGGLGFYQKMLAKLDSWLWRSLNWNRLKCPEIPKEYKCNPVDTGSKLNVHKTFRRRPGRLIYVQLPSCVYGEILKEGLKDKQYSTRQKVTQNYFGLKVQF